MTEANEALRRLLAQIGANTDVLVGGTPIQARQLLAEAGAALAGEATVLSVGSPIGELSLSALIAQISGRLDFDDQDDAILELGFKRLNGEGRTVLTLLAPSGISRSALRYVQHVARQSPRLVLVAYQAPAVAAMLAEPGFAALRERLGAAPAIEVAPPAPAPEPATATRAVATVAPVRTTFPAMRTAARAPARTRRPALWAASAIGMAAAGGIVWLAYGAPGGPLAVGPATRTALAVEPATLPAPALAGLPDPAAAAPSTPAAVAVASPPLVGPSASAPARLPRVALAAIPTPPLMHGEPAVAGLVPPAKADRAFPVRRSETARRDVTRSAHARPYWPLPRDQEPVDYRRAEPEDDAPPPPRWVRHDPGQRETPYLGTYAVDPYGMRIFRYDP